jgi:hypothetical protein
MADEVYDGAIGIDLGTFIPPVQYNGNISLKQIPANFFR